jgi:two-component system, NarL family, response regulator DevR
MLANPSRPLLKVFLVEDSALVRERMAALLGTLPGVAVVGEAADSDAAIRGLAASGAQVVLLDLQLGETSGMDLLAALPELDRAVISIVLTNHSTKSVREACVALGANYFFDKTREFTLALDTIAHLASSDVHGAAR